MDSWSFSTNEVNEQLYKINQNVQNKGYSILNKHSDY